MSKFLLIPNSNNKNFFDYNFDGFILPLKGYSIGFDYYFTVDEINEISETKKVYVIINKFLHSEEIRKIQSEIKNLKNIKAFFIEDLGLTNIIDKDKIILFQNHIMNNYMGINALMKEGINAVVLSNELTLEEINESKENTKSELYYFLINRNMLLYSKRKLVTNYLENYNEELNKTQLDLEEKVSKHELIIKEEGNNTVVFDKKIYSASGFLEKLKLENYIININNMSDHEINEILKNYNKELNLPNIDNYFLLNGISYKVKNEEV